MEQKTLYQIMIRIKDSFVTVLKDKLDVSEPTLLEERDHYFQTVVRDRTEKLTESEGKYFFETLTKEEHLFRVEQKELSEAEKDRALEAATVSVSFHRHRERYQVQSVEVSVDRIDELGTFLEIEGFDRAAVESLATSLGFRAPQFIEHPYDWLKR